MAIRTRVRRLAPAPARRLVHAARARIRPDAERRAEEAQAAASSGDWAGAAKAWRKAISMRGAGCPPEWRLHLGTALERLGDWPQAATSYRTAIARQPARPSWHAKLGRALEETGEYEEAVAALREAIERQGTQEARANWYVRLGRCLERCGSLEEAVEVYATALEAVGEASPARLFLRLAAAQRRLRSFSEAEQTLDRARERYPDDVGLAAESAEVAMARRDWQAAVARWEDVADLVVDGPRSPATLVRMATAYREVRAHETAEELTKRALALRPEYPPALFALAEISHRRLVRAEEVGTPHENVAATKEPQWRSMHQGWRDVIERTSGPRQAQAHERAYRSRLFLIEELFELGAPDRAAGELGAALDDLRHEGLPLDARDRDLVVRAASQVRTSGGVEPELHDELRGIVARLDTAVGSSTVGLRFYELLLWNNLLRAAQVARARVTERARLEAAAGDATAGVLNRAVRVAIEQGDLAAAGDYLDRLTRLAASPRMYDTVRTYYRLNRGDSSALAELAGRPVAADRGFADMIRGRSVAIVGPAPSGEAAGSEIDGFDIVVRCNYRGAERLPDPGDFGSRTDVAYYNVSDSRSLAAADDRTFLDELRYAVVKSIGFEFQAALRDEGRLRIAPPNWAQVLGTPNSIPVALVDILPFCPARVRIFHANLFVSREKHFAQYRPETAQGAAQNLRRKLRFDLHDPFSQLALTRNLWRSGMVEVDDRLAEVLELDDAAYARALEDSFLGS